MFITRYLFISISDYLCVCVYIYVYIYMRFMRFNRYICCDSEFFYSKIVNMKIIWVWLVLLGDSQKVAYHKP